MSNEDCIYGVPSEEVKTDFPTLKKSCDLKKKKKKLSENFVLSARTKRGHYLNGDKIVSFLTNVCLDDKSNSAISNWFVFFL